MEPAQILEAQNEYEAMGEQELSLGARLDAMSPKEWLMDGPTYLMGKTDGDFLGLLAAIRVYERNKATSHIASAVVLADEVMKCLEKGIEA